MKLEIKDDKALIYYELVADIVSIEDQKKLFLQAIEAGKPIEITTGQLERIDTASIQLLISFKKTLQVRNLPLKLENPSLEIKNIAELIGISNAFESSLGS